MILSNSSYPDIYQQMCAEREKVAFAVRKVKNKAKRIFSRRPVPAFLKEEYVVPASKNRYLIFAYAMTEREVNHDSFSCKAVLSLTRYDGRRELISLTTQNLFREEKKTGCEDFLQIFTGHFFARYRERSMLQARSTDPDGVAAIFFGRNSGFFQMLPFERLTLRAKDYPNGFAIQFNDGVSFGSDHSFTLPSGKNVNVFKHNTFISSSELKETQEKSVFGHDQLIGRVFRNLLSENDK